MTMMKHRIRQKLQRLQATIDEMDNKMIEITDKDKIEPNFAAVFVSSGMAQTYVFYDSRSLNDVTDYLFETVKQRANIILSDGVSQFCYCCPQVEAISIRVMPMNAFIKEQAQMRYEQSQQQRGRH